MKISNRRSISNLPTTLLCSLSLSLCFSAIAGGGDPETEESMFIESKSYNGSEDMPDGIAFYHVSSLIVGPDDLAGVQVSGFSGMNESDRIDLITNFADIDEAAAKSLLEGIAPSARGMLRESDVEVRKIVCVPALSSWDGKKAASVKSQLDDIREGVYAQYKTRAMIALDPEGQKNFQKLLRAMKLASSYGRIDYSQAYKGNLEGAKASLLSYCNM